MSTWGQVAGWLNAGRDVALAADQAYEYGTTGADPVTMAKNSAKYNALNGSGAPDSSGQVKDAATRSPALNAIAGMGSGGPSWWIVGAAVVGILAFLLVFRRK